MGRAYQRRQRRQRRERRERRQRVSAYRRVGVLRRSTIFIASAVQNSVSSVGAS
jgi:hypothetical protein